ncbi:MAG: TlyA family RNA methyltransferase [Rhizobiaceae bacterium]
MRLDHALVERGLSATRSRARDAILRGTVAVNGSIAARPGDPVSAGDRIAVDDPAASWVSRAALKLVHGLDHFGFDPAGRLALDIGASTGGFTQVLLERGARHVFAVDVGHGQIAPAIGGDPRVTLLEGLNARDLAAMHLGDVRPEAMVSDVSFISLRLALPPALDLAAPGAFGLFLVKPQFEAGRSAVGKRGIVPKAVALQTAWEVADWLATVEGWRVLGLTASPIEGGDGNAEFLLGAEKCL